MFGELHHSVTHSLVSRESFDVYVNCAVGTSTYRRELPFIRTVFFCSTAVGQVGFGVEGYSAEIIAARK